MRSIAWAGLLVAGCGDPAPCGEETDGGEPFPVCVVELVDGKTIDYCPGDQWAAADGCNSCGCDADGEVLCTSVTCD